MLKHSKKLISLFLSVVLVIGCISPLSAIGATNSNGSYAKGEAIAVMKSGSNAYTATSLKEQYGTTVKYKNSFKFGKKLNVIVVTSTTLSTPALIKSLQKDDSIEYAFPNYKKKASSITQDTYSDYQWALDNNGQNDGIADLDINPESIWEQTGSSTTENVVAIVDTGVDYTHPDLKNVMWRNPYGTKLAGRYGYDFCNYDSNPIDDNGHGSHCAGIVAAESNNNIGISGLCKSNTKIMALKWLDEEGSGYTDDVLACYDYIERAIDLGTNVVAVNNSWGGMGDQSELELFKEIFDTLGEKGAVSVVAAGNDGMDIKDVNKTFTDFFGEEVYSVPVEAGSAYQINVAATNSDGNIASYSNYSKELVDVAAPGTDILSTVSYNSFNPTVYTAEQREQLCASYQDYDDTLAEDEFGSISTSIPAESGIVAGPDADNQYFGLSGNSYSFVFPEGNKSGKKYYMAIPYSIADDSKNYSISFMSNNFDTDYSVYDLPADTKLDSSTVAELIEENYSIIDLMSDKGDDWVHVFFDYDVDLLSDYGVYKKSSDRILLFEFISYSDNSWFKIDDLAVSKQDVNPDDFGKYDFYSGTSMATPYVSGAVSLVRQSMGKDANIKDVINVVSNCGRIQSDLTDKTKNSKTLDLSDISRIPPSVYNVSYSSGKVVIDGKFSNVTEVKINNEKVSYTVSATKDKITVAGSQYLNHKTTVTVANDYGENSKTVTLTSTKGFTQISDAIIMSSLDGISMPAGNKTYVLSYDGMLSVLEYDEYSEFYYGDTDYDFDLDDIDLDEDDIFIDSAVYMNNNIYIVFSCPVYSSNDCIYGYNTYLYKYNITDCSFKRLCNLPTDTIEGNTLAVYNGRIYYIGGYDIDKNEYSRSVYRLSTDEKSFSKLSSLKSGVAYAKAVQLGDKLVLIGGSCATGNVPAIQVYNGTNWTKSALELKCDNFVPYVYFNGEACNVYGTNVVACKTGILCTGTFFDGLGESFVYYPNTDTAKRFGYSYKGDSSFVVLPAGNNVIAVECCGYDDIYGIGLDDSETYKAYKVPATHTISTIYEDYGNFTLKGNNDGYAEIGDRLTYKVTTPGQYIAEKLLVTNEDTGVTSSISLVNGYASFVVKGSCYTVSAKVRRVAPSDISSLKVTGVSGTKCTLTWSKATNAEGYTIQKYVDGEWVSVKSVSKDTLSYAVTLKTGNNKYRIRAYRTYNGKKYYSYSGTKTVYRPGQQKITSLSGGKGKFTVKYTKNTSATGYQIQYSRSSKMSSSKAVSVTPNTTVSKTVTKLYRHKTYYVRVRSYKTVDGKRIYGSWSTIKKVKVK
ncbi:MAG: S8 family serine peptidase [Eubacterium sp.]